MKRSKMIEIINLWNYYTEPNDNRSYGEVVLDLVETFGMLPPPDDYELLRFDDKDGVKLKASYNRIILNSNTKKETQLLWEKEDA